MTNEDVLLAVKQINRVVFLKTDEYQMERLVIEIIISGREIKYMLACGAEQSIHYESEITTERKVHKM